MRKLYYLSILFFIGCSSSFSNPFLMPKIEIANEELKKIEKKLFYIQSFEDKRKSKIFISVLDKTFKSDAEVGPVVRESLTKALVDKGFSYSKDAKLIFKVFILEWSATVEDNFFSTIKSNAEIQTDIYDRSGKKVFSGKYQGMSSISDITLNDQDALRGLGQSMKEAILKFVNSNELAELIAKN